jgi:gamma-aminobutyric acid receptor subunit beta
MQTDKFADVSSTLDNLLDGYDVRLRPNFGGRTLNVSMEVKIAGFDSISEANMDYTITMYLIQYWHDDRLIYGKSSDHVTLMGDYTDRIWIPDTFIANDKYAYLHDVTEKNKMIKIYGNGDVVYGMRFTSTLACMMDLRNYPLDNQNCTVEIESCK